MIGKRSNNNKNQNLKNITSNKAGLIHKIRDLDIRYI
jgi:hypothetical protein